MNEPAEITIKALEQIEEIYFGIEVVRNANLNYAHANSKTRRVAFRHWERVFCYELYHRIRNIIEKKVGKGENSKYWGSVILQGELQKNELEEITLSKYNIKQLEKEFIPDLIFHNIKSTEYQELIIEVKTKPKLIFPSFKNDLIKLSQFITNYKFKEGMLIIANNNFEAIKKKIKTHNSQLNIDYKKQEKIYIVVKENALTKAKFENLGNIIK